MMKTHTEITVWIGNDPTVEVHTTEGCSWAVVDDCITIHALDYDTGKADLAILETFFQRGLDAVIKAQNPRLFKSIG